MANPSSLNPFKNYLRSLIDNVDKINIPKEMNLVLEGGAFNGGYMGGMLLYIRELERLKLTKIQKISGCSIGAITALLYLSDNIDKGTYFFEKILGSIRKTLSLSEIIPLIRDIVELVDISKINNKLFIAYYDVSEMKQIVVSTYKNKEELIDTVIRSSFIPYIIDGNLKYQDKYCDGLTPYIFKKESIPTLFIALQAFKKIKYTLYVKNEINIWSRLLEGVVDIHGFFTNNSSNFCSYIDKWNLLDFHIFHFRELCYFLFVVILHYSSYIETILPNNIKNNKYLLRIITIFSTLYKTIFSYLII
jgi:hypothetical protein